MPVSSVEAKRALPQHSAYTSAKHTVSTAFRKPCAWSSGTRATDLRGPAAPGAINTLLFDKSSSKLGLKPMCPPPLYEPGTGAHHILCAAEHPARGPVAGEQPGMVLDQRLSPRLMGALRVRPAFALQKTNEPNPENASDNHFAPMRGHRNTSEDAFEGQTLHRSLYN
jgi:hypothetical protein